MKLLQCNNPIRSTPGVKHKFIERSCHEGIEKVLRFGARGYEDFTQHKDPVRKKSFRARHKCDMVIDKNTPRYWACEYLWNKKTR